MAFLFQIWAMDFVCFNGEIRDARQPLFTAQNRSFRYGDGVFETMKVHRGKAPLATLHFERLFLSLNLLGLRPRFSGEELGKHIMETCEKNGCAGLARVRLAVYRTDENQAGFVIEAGALSDDANKLNEKGWVIGLYPYARKSTDALANLKSANFLPYVLADRHAKENGLDDCLVLNCDNRVADASKANIFLVKKGEIFTPALHQGCVSGVMRGFLIDGLKKTDFPVHQQEIKEADLLEADEVFLTNAIYGMRWVACFKEKEYSNTLAAFIYRKILATLYE